MTVSPEAIEDWFVLVPHLLLREGWEIAVENDKCSLCHCDCPWGGHIIKCILGQVRIKNPPNDSSHIFIRPETRARYQAECGDAGRIELLQLLSPGEAIIKRWTPWGMLRLCTVLFGKLAAPYVEFSFTKGDSACTALQKVCRDYPLRGDSAVGLFQDSGEPSEGILHCRPDGEGDGTFQVCAIFSVTNDKFARWATTHFSLLLNTMWRTCEWFLNRPGVLKMRELDEQAYVALTIQSWQRGFPFLPLPRDSKQEPTVTIAAGEDVGLPSWIRFTPLMASNDKFRFAEYLQLFLENLGLRTRVFDMLDGRLLVPYQCVVRKEAWMQIREHFFIAFSLQKTAYRHANGGTTAPNVHDHSKPRFVPRASCENLSNRILRAKKMSAQHSFVVRHTFVEVQTDSSEECEDPKPASRHCRRPKTDTMLRVKDTAQMC
mmetsp:Transcript_41127/g.73654  ORF Transcript_41127/g.73654 Transcript_41127/m.73654 type:complete len:432 (-) Transcript_41127:335-1630(-)